MKSGELARLIGGARASEKGELSTALPAEVPVISMVSADGVGAFTDLGYPARVADEYVRCPDLHDPDAFAARVVGDAMDPDYRPGDIVVFSPAAGRDGRVRLLRALVRDRETTFSASTSRWTRRGCGGADPADQQPVPVADGGARAGRRAVPGGERDPAAVSAAPGYFAATGSGLVLGCSSRSP
ncbi:MAG: hypothetical protein R3B49_10555 [Phycisphaerales bacterium]